MNRMLRFALLLGLAGVMAIITPIAGWAHENRQVADGVYNLEVGFISEPAFVNQQNGLFLMVQRVEPDVEVTPSAVVEAEEEAGHHGDGSGVIGLESTLQAEVIYINQRMPLVLSPTEQPGVYESIFFPTAVGDYSFRIYGTIEGISIDETFTSSPQGFDSVKDPAPLQFPNIGG